MTRYAVWWGPVVVVVAVWFLNLVGRVGWQMLSQLPAEFFVRAGWLVLGWGVGWKLFSLGAYMKRFNLGWGAVFEGWDGSVRSVWVLAAMVVLGVWMVSSGTSVLGWGTVMSLQLRMGWELGREKDYRVWYKGIGREVTSRENWLVMAVAAVVWLWQMFRLIGLGVQV